MILSHIKNRFVSRLKESPGFTMIELLVVIAVIGVLAVAVLSSINPIEQVNKGRDTRTRSDAAQLINAIERYFAIHEIYPWNDPKYAIGGALTGTDLLPNTQFPFANSCAAIDTSRGGTSAFCSVRDTSAYAFAGGTYRGWLGALAETQEVKTQFVSRLSTMATPYDLKVYKGTGYNSTTYVCFKPTSKAFQDEALTKCITGPLPPSTNAIVPPGACPQASYVAGTTTYGTTDPTAEWICLP